MTISHSFWRKSHHFATSPYIPHCSKVRHQASGQHQSSSLLQMHHMVGSTQCSPPVVDRMHSRGGMQGFVLPSPLSPSVYYHHGLYVHRVLAQIMVLSTLTRTTFLKAIKGILIILYGLCRKCLHY